MATILLDGRCCLSLWKLLADFTYQREALVQELVLSLVMTGQEREALDELELCESVIFRCYIHAPNSGNPDTFHRFPTKKTPCCIRTRVFFVYDCQSLRKPT